MNIFDDVQINVGSFSFKDLLGLDRWTAFTPVFTSLTVVGTPTYTGRWRRVGRSIEFQATFVSTTSVASVSGTTYMDLPVKPAAGLTGICEMTNITTKTPFTTAGCVVDVANTRVYLGSTGGASANTWGLFGKYEI